MKRNKCDIKLRIYRNILIWDKNLLLGHPSSMQVNVSSYLEIIVCVLKSNLSILYQKNIGDQMKRIRSQEFLISAHFFNKCQGGTAKCL